MTALERASRRGCISDDTLTHRVSVAAEARTALELAALVADLPPLTLRTRLKALVSDRLQVGPSLRRLSPPVENGGGPFLIGRSPFCDFRVYEPTVSDRHAVLTRANDHWVIADLGSRNGTRVNGWIVKEAAIAPGDQIELGGIQFVFDPA